MQIRKLLTDDDAVSPVIGVILMVAITVILAAVIGAFVLGFGGGGPSAPSVQWDTSQEDGLGGGSNTWAVFEHSGGDTVNDPTVLSAGGAAPNDLQYYDGSSPATIDSSTPALETGSELVVDTGGTPGTTGEYTLIWNSPDSDSTQELATHNV